MNQMLERVDALEKVSWDQQRRIDELNSDRRNKRLQIDELESRVRKLKCESKKRQIEAVDGSTKRIKISGVTVDLSMFDGNLVLKVLSYLAPADLVNAGRTCRRFGLTQDGQQRSLTNEAARHIFENIASEYEMSVLPKYDDESEVSLLREVYLLREPLVFEQLVGRYIRYKSDGSKSEVTGKGDEE